MADDFSFDIVEKIGTLSESKSGWKMQLNKVSWGGRPAKFDIRSWSPDYTKMGKGITLSEEELLQLKKLLDKKLPD
ncbi:MAG: PC4/YdbC family ssDNA-binding protein [Treponema sp.]|jgi:hypothetical protein|nr:PC4/YdbC family ssDNA-binding protein [Treponema sp.]